ncbi:MAG: Mur ligase family protein [Actinomycetota bacterium]|nr:Mur ligase family protein [Nitrospiraceae bacterium]MDA8157143.1 Mur ligase family protein [Actinomycetota bacterium]
MDGNSQRPKSGNQKPLRIFFSGIGGSGVSALAGFAAEKGHLVSGSDRAFDKDPSLPVFGALLAKGIRLVQQDGNGLDGGTDLAVFSTAVEPGTPEYKKAAETGLNTITRPEYLARLSSEFRTIAVAGTSGKSTSSGMLAWLLKELGFAPNFIGGGRVKRFATETNQGNYLTGGSDILVIEACESDGSIINYHPAFSVLLNLALDHHSISETGAMFETLSKNTSGPTVFNADDEELLKLSLKNSVSFGIDRPADYMAEDIRLSGFGAQFVFKGGACGPGLMKLNVPGRHNVYNALAALALVDRLAAGSGMRMDNAALARALAGFDGVQRRFDVHLNKNGITVIDDYAHNPHKIAAFMAAAQRISTKICYIFQPHGYGPARMMRQGYAEAFSGGLRAEDLLIMLPIYYAGGTTQKDISSEMLAEDIAARGKAAIAVKDRQAAAQAALGFDCIIVLGARDDTLSRFASELASFKSKPV